MSSSPSPPAKEHPLSNIAWNVLIPIAALSFLSKGDNNPLTTSAGEHFWNLGPLWGMLVAVSLPLGYAIIHLIHTHKINMFSLLGIIGILLTGGIALFTYQKNGTVSPNASQLFAIKEAAIPLIFGITIFLSHWTKTPLVRIVLYNKELFDIARIEEAIATNQQEKAYQALLLRGTLLLFASFLMSALLNYFLALFFLQDISSQEAFNHGVAKLTGWGFAVIGLPMLLTLSLTLWYFVAQIKRLTGLNNEAILLAR